MVLRFACAQGSLAGKRMLAVPDAAASSVLSRPPAWLALLAGEPGPLHGGGGMLVGPGDPIFGPGRLGGGVGGPPGRGALPPGARWDPIAPPGMRGFHPGEAPGRAADRACWLGAC